MKKENSHYKSKDWCMEQLQRPSRINPLVPKSSQESYPENNLLHIWNLWIHGWWWKLCGNDIFLFFILSADIPSVALKPIPASIIPLNRKSGKYRPEKNYDWNQWTAETDTDLQHREIQTGDRKRITAHQQTANCPGDRHRDWLVPNSCEMKEKGI